jgi:NADH-quinone oxidoreductase subunit L
LLSGWYSKDQILAHAFGSAETGGSHPALFLLPVVTVVLTGYYMTRLWLLAFAGGPRDRHLYDHAHESPAVMTVPLVILAAFSVGVAWGWPLWDADKSYLGGLLKAGEPATAVVEHAHHQAHEGHTAALVGGLLAAALGVGVAVAAYRAGRFTRPATVPAVRAFLYNRLYFDELYDRLVTRPTLTLSAASGALDKRPTDGQTDATADRRIDPGTLDGLLNAVGQAVAAAGRGLHPLQSGRLRGYVLVLGLTVVAALGILWALTR